jgi:site-specific DNA-methyltransferase (adenine-specific)
MQTNRIILGDCCRVMPTLPPACADFILTDPPYLVNYKDREGRSIKNDIEADWLMPAFREAYRVLKPDSLCVSFYGWSKIDLFYSAWKAAGFRIVGHISFPKRYASASRLMRYSHENAYLLAKGSPRPPEHPIGDVIDWSYSGNRHHPTEKPLSVLTPLIESFCPRGGLVLDPFAGSASTLVAARSVGRQYLGIELDPNYHGAAVRRLNGFSAGQAAYLDRERAASASVYYMERAA